MFCKAGMSLKIILIGENVTIPISRRHSRRYLCGFNTFLQCSVVSVMFIILNACAFSSATNNFVGNGVHEPKFGERLLPLLRNKTIGATKTGAAVPQGILLQKNANSFKFMIKRERHQRAQGTSFPHDAFAMDEYETLMSATSAGVHPTVSIAPPAANSKIESYAQPEERLINASKADRLEMSTEFFVVPTSSSIQTLATPAAGKRAVIISSTVLVNPANTQTATGASFVKAPLYNAANNANTGSGGSLRKEPWVVPVLVFASLTMFMMGAFEIFVLFKAWRTSPSRRHLFLGQMLLFGLFACAGLAAIITAQPTLLSCGILRFGVGVAYALVFAALLVKCVFLISLNGGVYLPAPYQGLLLLFSVLIQVAIGAQWLLTQPPELYTLHVNSIFNRDGSPTISSSYTYSNTTLNRAHLMTEELKSNNTITLVPMCKSQFSQLLFSLSYIFFLIIFVAVLATKSRGIRENYREATYIGLAIGGAIPIWCSWMLCGLAVTERHKDACVAFGLVATSVSVFLVMFMPKGRQLAAMGKEGLCVEDREEQFSSLSRAGSGYSPSFFHFKPIKYGMMGGGCTGGTTGATLNISNASGTINGVHNKHGNIQTCNINEAPPSYTRMYHYFPTQLRLHPFSLYPQPPLIGTMTPTVPVPTSTLAPSPLSKLTPKLTSKPTAQIPPLPPPPKLKQIGQSLSSKTHAHIAQTLRYPGLFVRPNETNLYTTLEPTLSSNPNVYFQRGGAVHPGMMY